MDNYIYEFNNSIYINLTNRCSNDCAFCLRRTHDGMGGVGLWLDREPDGDEVIALLRARDLSRYEEAVFCGFGEPTYKHQTMVQVAAFCKANGMRTRLNTNGQGSLINGYDISGEVCAVIDTVSISLNADTAERYQADCSSIFGEAAFGALLDFATRCATCGAKTILSVVDCIGEEQIERCRAVAKGTGAEFRVRAFE